MAPGRIVITGAAGRIGRLLRAHLVQQGADLLLLDRDPGGDPAIVGVFNLVSDNAGMTWDLGENLRLLGWAPGERSQPVAPPGTDQAAADISALRRARRWLRRPLAWLCRRLQT